ncbi:MAG: nucleotidyltransferase domain-containing protein [Magnetococcales bacterium]|nr:nucleotidyltransferase domain-containing protein [Magnetococcales bacterium]
MVEKIMAALPRVIAIYAMGDRIEKGSGTMGAPLELAILMEGEADPVTLWSLSMELSRVADCRVELLDLRVSSTQIQYQVVTTAERWWISNPQAGLFECFVLSEKTALEESRADLLAGLRPEARAHCNQDCASD